MGGKRHRFLRNLPRYHVFTQREKEIYRELHDELIQVVEEWHKHLKTRYTWTFFHKNQFPNMATLLICENRRPISLGVEEPFSFIAELPDLVVHKVLEFLVPDQSKILALHAYPCLFGSRKFGICEQVDRWHKEVRSTLLYVRSPGIGHEDALFDTLWLPKELDDFEECGRRQRRNIKNGDSEECGQSRQPMQNTEKEHGDFEECGRRQRQNTESSDPWKDVVEDVMEILRGALPGAFTEVVEHRSHGGFLKCVVDRGSFR